MDAYSRCHSLYFVNQMALDYDLARNQAVKATTPVKEGDCTLDQ